MTIDEMIAVLQAAKAGKQIECRCNRNGAWITKIHPAWNTMHFDYRVKPEPREWRLPPQVLHGFYYDHDDPQGKKFIRVREVL